MEKMLEQQLDPNKSEDNLVKSYSSLQWQQVQIVLKGNIFGF